jgi:hypothetical protein
VLLCRSPGLVFTCLIVSIASFTWALDALYRCPDGTFTNRVELQCVPYEAKGIVRVQGETVEAAKQPFADVKVFQGPVKDTGKGR